MKYAKVYLERNIGRGEREFDYRIPDDLEGRLSIGDRVLIPFGKANRIEKGYLVKITEDTSYDPARVKDIIGISEDGIGVSERQMKLAFWMRGRYGGSVARALGTVIPVKVKVTPKESRLVRLNAPEEIIIEHIQISEHKKYKARARLLGALLKEGKIPEKIIRENLNISPQTIASTGKLGLIEVVKTTEYRTPIKIRKNTQERFRPNDAQQEIIDDIIRHYEENDHLPCLVHGVTGSGKTLIYLELSKYAASKGKAVILLIPEISLTFQTVMRFYGYFGDRVSVLNSRMSRGERYDQYLRAKNGEIDVIIGPRSALFTPFEDLGFVIVDEEHEDSYKSQITPKYDAREVAGELCRMAGAMLILGSATPSVESYYRARQGHYRLYEMKKRAKGASLPEVLIADMRQELKDGNKGILSNILKEKLSETLEKKEQAMLFLNRRGMYGFVSCRSCGSVIKCPHCDVSLSEHRGGILKCHYCGYRSRPVKLCPSCGSPFIGSMRMGTQKVEEILKEEYKGVRILRMDADTTRKKGDYERILSVFANQEADILLGTQMIVKGHDFPNVTLSCALAADISLYAQDFRAAEKTYRILAQAAGRTGRDRKKGTFIIQTYNPTHYSIALNKKGSYRDFYEEEIKLRRLMHYPPSEGLLKVLIQGRDPQRTMDISGELSGQVSKDHPLVRIIGPAEDVPGKVNDRYRWAFYLSCRETDELVRIKNYIEDFVDAYFKEKKIRDCDIFFEIL